MSPSADSCDHAQCIERGLVALTESVARRSRDAFDEQARRARRHDARPTLHRPQGLRRGDRGLTPTAGVALAGPFLKRLGPVMPMNQRLDSAALLACVEPINRPGPAQIDGLIKWNSRGN
jgi:hypothetical protein